MRIITCIILTVLAATLFSAQGFSQRAKKPDTVSEEQQFANNRCFAKGGLGIIDKDFYVVVKLSKKDKNGLRFGQSGRWDGLSAGTPEVVIFYEGKIWSQQALPKRFDLSKAIVISFESDKIRFFDFHTMSGGYYMRLWVEN